MPDPRLVSLSLDEYLDHLAAAEPTPGGGSAAALVAALAAALGRMACGYTLGRPRFAAAQAEISRHAERLARADRLLRRLIDEDATAYGLLVEAWKLTPDIPDRPMRIATAAATAASVPLQIAALARVVSAELAGLAARGNPRLRPDIESALNFARTAAAAALKMVRVNLPLLDEAVRESFAAEADGLDPAGWPR